MAGLGIADGPGVASGTGVGMKTFELDDEDLRMLKEQQEMLEREREIRQKFEERMEEEELRLSKTRAGQGVFHGHSQHTSDAQTADAEKEQPETTARRIPNVRFHLRLGYATSHLALGQRVKVAVGQWKLVLRQSIAAVCGLSLQNVTLVPPKNDEQREEGATEVKVMAQSKQEAYRVAGAIRIATSGDGLKMALDNRGLGIIPELVGEPAVDTGEDTPRETKAQVQIQPVTRMQKDTADEVEEGGEQHPGIDAKQRLAMIEHLLRTGQGFGSLLEASFFSTLQELEPARRTVHVTEGPYMHVTFVLRDPIWVGMSMQMALLEPFMLPPQSTSSDHGDGGEGEVAARIASAMAAVWQMPHAADLAAQGMLKQALDVALRELTSALALNFHPPAVAALANQRMVVLLNVAGMDVLAGGEGRAGDALEMLQRAEVLTRMGPQGGSGVCTCGQEKVSTPCNRALLRLATLTNLANYYRQRGLLNAAHQYMARALRIALRTRPEDSLISSTAAATRSVEWKGGALKTPLGNEAARTCQVIRGKCGAAGRLNQGVLLITMRNYEEGLRCCAAALSRLQEEWALSRQSLYDPVQSLDRFGPVARSTAMVSEIAVCMFNAGVCHEQLYRAQEALDAYSRAAAIASLLPKRNPLRVALRGYLGSLHTLRQQMEQLDHAGRARTPRSPRRQRSPTDNRSPTSPLSDPSTSHSSPVSPAHLPFSMPLPSSRIPLHWTSRTRVGHDGENASIENGRETPVATGRESAEDWKKAWDASLGLMSQSLGWRDSPIAPHTPTARLRRFASKGRVIAPAALHDRPRTAPAPQVHLPRPGWGVLGVEETGGEGLFPSVKPKRTDGEEEEERTRDFGTQVVADDISGDESAGERSTRGATGRSRVSSASRATRAAGDVRKGRPATAGAAPPSRLWRSSPFSQGPAQYALNTTGSLPASSFTLQSPYLPLKPSSAPRRRQSSPGTRKDRAKSAGSGGRQGGDEGRQSRKELSVSGLGSIGIKEESKENVWSDEEGDGEHRLQDLNFVELSKSFLRSDKPLDGLASSKAVAQTPIEEQDSADKQKEADAHSPAPLQPKSARSPRRLSTEKKSPRPRETGSRAGARSSRGSEVGRRSRSPGSVGKPAATADGTMQPTPPRTASRSQRPGTSTRIGGRRRSAVNAEKKEAAGPAVPRGMGLRRARGGCRVGLGLPERLQMEKERKERDAAERERRRAEWEQRGEGGEAVYRLLLRIDLSVAEGAAAVIQMSYRGHTSRTTVSNLARNTAASRLQAGLRRRLELVRHWREGGKEGHKRVMARAIQGAWRCHVARRIFSKLLQRTKAAKIQGMASHVGSKAREWGGWEGAGPDRVLQGMLRKRDLYERMYLKHMSRKYKMLPSRFPAATQQALLGLVMERAEMQLCTALSAADRARLSEELSKGLSRNGTDPPADEGGDQAPGGSDEGVAVE